MKLPVFGLHVGNSTASLAIYKDDGKIDIISNEIGDRVTPAVVTVLNCEKLIGSVAKSLSFQKFSCSILENKRLMNKSMSEMGKEEACLKSRVSIEYVNGEFYYSIPFEEKFEKYTPAQISTLIYKKLYDIAKSAVHGGDGDDISCVILIPTYFDSDSISYTKQAVENAGWKILQMIKEPVAPILAYSLLNKNFNEKSRCPQLKAEGLSPCDDTIVVVYHLGGVSCEATVLKIFSGMVQILGTTFKDNIGANLLINSLTNFLAEEFYRKYKLDPSESHKSMGKLRQAAETCMHSLSNLINADCFVESLYDGVDFKHSVSRARLEACLVPILNIYSEPIYDVLQKTGLTSDHVQKVILSGGLMKVPKLKSHISGMFVNAEVLSKFSPDEVMALGAAQQAGYILSYNKNKFSQRKSAGNCPETTDKMLPITSSVELTNQLIEVSIKSHCNRMVRFDKFSIIPCHELIYIDNLNATQEDQQTFFFEVFVEGELKHNGELIVTSGKDVSYEICVSITVEKKLVIKFTTKHLVLNKKETKTVHFNSVTIQ